MINSKWIMGNELKYLTEVVNNFKDNIPFTDRLEESFCKKFKVKYAIAVNSATSGLHACLIAGGIGEGDEVITTPFTVLVDSSLPIIVGATPVFADIDYNTHNIDPNSIEKLITKKTKAIIPVSFHGLPCNMDRIMEIAKKYNLLVIEDNAQAILAKYKGKYVGEYAPTSVFSFERTKHVSCGEGGMVVTNSEELAVKIRKFAGMGFKDLTASKSKLAAITPKLYQNPDYKRHDSIGLNYRLSEFCSAVALAQFERVDEIVEFRKKVAKMYDKIFKGSDIIPQTIPEECESSYFTYAVKSPHNWKKFYNTHLNKGGDDFYAAMSLAYREPIMVEKGYEKYKNTCLNAEKLQPTIMQFKTNYVDLKIAENYINILGTTINEF